MVVSCRGKNPIDLEMADGLTIFANMCARVCIQNDGSSPLYQ